MLAHLKTQQLIGSMGSQKILWDLKDLKKYFEISKISKNTLGSQRSQKILWDLKIFVDLKKSARISKNSAYLNFKKILNNSLDLRDLKNTSGSQIILVNLPFAKRQMNSGDHGGKLDQKASKL